MKSTAYGRMKCRLIMNRIFVTVFVFLISMQVSAQDAELNRLTDIVKSLQTGGEKAYNAAVAKLAADKNWTPMDEIGFDRNIECKASERVPGFKLNSVLTNAENIERYQTTTGNHINGADGRFNYSLFEKTLKPGKTAEFLLPERWGEQTIIILPYQGEKARMTAGASSGSNIFTVTSMGNGAVKLTGKAIKGQPLSLKVTNGSEGNISYVILNHNSRK